MVEYIYDKQFVSAEILQRDILNDSNISQPVAYMVWDMGAAILKIVFEADLTSGEQSSLQTTVMNHQGGNGILRKENYSEKQYTTKKLMVDVWWETYSNDTYSDKSREIIYEWSGNRLISETEKKYCTDGNLYSESKWTYYTNGNNVSKRQNY